MPKSKVFNIIITAAKSLGTVVYIILKKMFKVETSSIIRNFFNMAVVIFFSIMLILKLDEVRFWHCYLPNQLFLG